MLFIQKYFSLNVDFSDGINNSGIILEIIGFVLILIAVKHKPRQRPIVEESIRDFKNIVTTEHPSIYYAGIGLVIAGLVLQLISSFY